MASLKHCISIHSVPKPIADHITREAKAYRAEGVDGATATIRAVKDYIKIVEAQRLDVISQINAAIEKDYPELLQQAVQMAAVIEPAKNIDEDRQLDAVVEDNAEPQSVSATDPTTTEERSGQAAPPALPESATETIRTDPVSTEHGDATPVAAEGEQNQDERQQIMVRAQLKRETKERAKAEKAARRRNTETVDFMGLQQAYEALEGMAKAGAEAMPHLVEIGKAVFRNVGKTLQSFTDGMKTVLGELYPRFRSLIVKVYNDVSRILKDERGLVEPDINNTDDTQTLEAELNNPDFQARAKSALQWAGDAVKNAGKFMSPLGHLEGKDDYLHSRYRLLGNLDAIGETVKRLYKSLDRAHKTGDTEALFKYFTTKDADVNIIQDQEVREAAIRAKRQIIAIGDALVERGWLKLEKHEQTAGSYLPRAYLKHILGESAFKTLSGGKKLDKGYLKARQDIPADVRRIVLGEVTDAAYLAAKAISIPLRDLAVSEWLETIAADRQHGWVLPGSLVSWQLHPEDKPRKVTPFWLKGEASRLRNQAKYVVDADAKEMRDLADRMEDQANEALEYAGVDPNNIELVPKGYKAIPKSPRYGVLRGMIVKKEVYNDIVGSGKVAYGEAEFLNAFGRVLSQYTGLWKFAKVAANIPGQVRNAVSNMVLLHLSGVPFLRVPQRVVQAILEIVGDGKYSQFKGKYFAIAKRGGVLGSSFANVELGKIESDLRAKLHRGHEHVTMMDAVRFVIHAFKLTKDKLGDIYQFMESVSKTAKIIDEMDRRGVDEKTAILAAHEALFDYSLVPQSIRVIRSLPIGAPFITFLYKALPLVAKTADTKPWRLLPYVVLFKVLPLIVVESLGLDDDDYEELIKMLPEWMQGKGHLLPLPFKDSIGRWQFMDASYFMPWTPFTDIAKSLTEGDLVGAAQSTSLLGGPTLSMIMAVTTGEDPFTKRKIVPETDATPAEKLTGWLSYLWRLNMPSMITDQGAAGKIWDAIQETPNRHGDPKVTMFQALARIPGVNIYPVDFEQSRQDNTDKYSKIISDLRRERTMQLKNVTDEAERERITRKYDAKITKRILEKEQYIKDTERLSQKNNL